MNDREMELEDLITSRSGDVLRLKAKADAAMPEMAKVWRDEARRAALTWLDWWPSEPRKRLCEWSTQKVWREFSPG